MHELWDRVCAGRAGADDTAQRPADCADVRSAARFDSDEHLSGDATRTSEFAHAANRCVVKRRGWRSAHI